MARDLPKPIALPPPDCIWRMKNSHTPMISSMGNQLIRIDSSDRPLSAGVTAVSTLLAFSSGHSVLSAVGTVVTKGWPLTSSPFTWSPWKVTFLTCLACTCSVNLE